MQKLVLFLVIGALSGCTGTAHYRGSVTVTSTAPDMAYVAPGVRVIADYDEPIFFSNGYYWYSDNGYWYRSTYYSGGWVFVDSPPVAITSISRPYAYVHYRPHGYVAHRRPVPAHRFERPVVRDHRAARRGTVYHR